MSSLAPQVGFEPTTLRFNSASLHTFQDQPAAVKFSSKTQRFQRCPQGRKLN